MTARLDAFMACAVVVAVADPTVLPSPSESYSLGPAPTSPATTPTPTPEVEVGTAVQTRRRTVRTCAATFTGVEERVDDGPSRVAHRTIYRHPCRIPTVIAGGL